MNRGTTLSQAIAILMLILLAGCATTTPPIEPAESPLEAERSSETPSIETTTPNAPLDDVVPMDLQTIITNVVDVMLHSRAIANHNPQVAFAEVKDNTHANLDRKEISNQIRTQLINSGKVRLIADEDDHEINDDKTFRLQNNSRPLKSRFDKLKAAHYRLIVIIHDTPPKKYNMAAHYYRVTLSLLDKTSGDLLWIDEKDNVKPYRQSSITKK